MADELVDQFLDALASFVPGEKEVARTLESAGVTDEQIEQLSDKTAGFGDALKVLRHALIRPFLNLGRLVTSAKFRGDVKGAFRRALSHEIRATKHAVSVAGRLARGEAVPPPERKAATRQLLSILITVVFAYSAGPGVQGLFSGSLWRAFQTLVMPVQEIIALVLRKPLHDAAKKVLFSD